MRPIEQTISSVKSMMGVRQISITSALAPAAFRNSRANSRMVISATFPVAFNNQNNPEFGAANEPFIRISDVRLGTDGAPRGVVNGVQTLPNERDISNVIVNQDENGDGIEEKTTSVHDTNLFLMTFGLFFDHGLDFLARSPNAADSYTIALKPGDPLSTASPMMATGQRHHLDHASPRREGDRSEYRPAFHTAGPYQQDLAVH